MRTWDPELWDRSDMWAALAQRDIGAVYRKLCDLGLTQSEIAARTGQAQSEVSAIMAGRQVMAYGLLERIAAAFDIPRGRLGLAYQPEVPAAATHPDDEREARANQLAHAANVSLGWPAFGEPEDLPWVTEPTPAPRRVTGADITQLARLTDDVAALERRAGGGVVLPMLTAQITSSRTLLRVTAGDDLRRAVRLTIALLHRRASCAAFDIGLLDVARQHVLSALELAREASEPRLQACLFYCAGRMELYHGPPDSALRLFQFGQSLALPAGLPQLRALLEINEARAYAQLGSEDHARRAMSSAIELFHEDVTDVPEWLNFFDAAELYGAAGMVWRTLGDEDRAIAAFRRSLAGRADNSILYRTFDQAELAACHLRAGDISEGVRVGTAAVETARDLHSRRARTRLRVLLAATARGGRATRSLRVSIAELCRSRAVNQPTRLQVQSTRPGMAASTWASTVTKPSGPP
jgi:transcriptional regulator with XRE-family HTH domain